LVPKQGKHTKLPHNYQIVIKHANIFHAKALQNVSKLEFWFENKPFGDPGPEKLSSEELSSK
jgi:hypothetical protein